MADSDVDTRAWDDEDPDQHDDDTEPYWFPGHGLPGHARQMGLTHHTQEGALLEFAGRLDSTKTHHKVMAWFLLVVFGLPVVFAVMRVVLFL